MINSIYKMCTRLIFVMALLSLMGNAAYAEDATQTGSINVSVISQTQDTSGVNVTALNWVDSSYRGEVVTDGNGLASFSDVPVGNVDVFATNQNGDVVAKANGAVTNDAALELLLEF